MAEFDPGRPALALTKELRELGTAERAAQEKRYPSQFTGLSVIAR